MFSAGNWGDFRNSPLSLDDKNIAVCLQTNFFGAQCSLFRLNVEKIFESSRFCKGQAKNFITLGFL